MHTQATPEIVPWYRVKLVWLVVAIPTATVIGCMFTIFLAITNPDTVYKRVDPAASTTVETPAQ